MRRLGPWIIAMAVPLLSLGAAAQGTYAVGSIGRADWAFDCGPSGCERAVTAWRAGAGYRYNRVVALEAFYIDFGRARSTTFSMDGTLRSSGPGAQALLGWQFGDLDLAGKIGLADLRNEFRAAPTSYYSSSSRSSVEVIGGLMAAYHVTPTLALRLDADIVTVALDGDSVFYSRGSDVRSFMLGLEVRF